MKLFRVSRVDTGPGGADALPGDPILHAIVSVPSSVEGREWAKRAAFPHLGGNLDRYVVEPLIGGRDRVVFIIAAI